MYKLPVGALCLNYAENTLEQLIIELSIQTRRLEPKSFNILYLPLDTVVRLNQHIAFKALQKHLIQNKVTLIAVPNLTWGILCYIPPGVHAPKFPLGYPTLYNRRNKETSCLFLKLDQDLV